MSNPNMGHEQFRVSVLASMDDIHKKLKDIENKLALCGSHIDVYAQERKLSKTERDKINKDLHVLKRSVRGLTSKAQRHDEDIKTLKDKTEEVMKDRLCCICMAATRTVQLEPCRHVAVCQACVKKVISTPDKTICPICRTHIESYRHVY